MFVMIVIVVVVTVAAAVEYILCFCVADLDHF